MHKRPHLKALISLTLLPLLSLADATAADIWIDVRSASAQQLFGVAGDPRIELEQMGRSIKTLAPNLETPIHLYCWLGFDAEKAKLTLETLGYTQVSSGGILEARQERVE